jgi:hypothetical protein
VKRWVHGKSSLRAALGFSGGLSGMRYKSFGIDKRKLLSFFSVAILNEKIPADERHAILSMFRDYPGQFKDDQDFQNEILQVLADMVLKSKDHVVKLEAAKTLVKAYSFESNERQKLLRELMESEESGEGGRFLREHFDDIDAIE